MVNGGTDRYRRAHPVESSASATHTLIPASPPKRAPLFFLFVGLSVAGTGNARTACVPPRASRRFPPPPSRPQRLHARRLPVIVLDRFTVPDQTDLAVAIKQFLQPRLASPA